MKAVINVKKTGRKIISAALILVMAGSMLLSGCDKEGDRKKEMKLETTQNARKLTKDPANDDLDVDTGTDAPEVELTAGKKPVRSTGTWQPLAENEFLYDIKVTTHNVGHFYYGVTNLDVYGAQEKVDPGILPEYIMNAYNDWMTVKEDLDSDIYAFQEWDPVFLIDTKKDLTISAEEAFDGAFQTLKYFEGKTGKGVTLYNALGVSKNSQFALTDISSGFLGAKDKETQRLYVKGYTTVAGKRVAVFCIHLIPYGTSGDAARQDSMRELAYLMSQEEYAIAMGDTNSNDIAAFMRKAGFHVANRDKFGDINTYYYSEGEYIDNIFTTSNIDIQYVECDKNRKGGSDHYPLTAYLKIKDETNSAGIQVPVGEDGFMDGWYRP